MSHIIAYHISSGYLALQTDSNLAYTCFCLSVLFIAIWGIVLNSGSWRIESLGPIPVADAVAFVVGYGPFLFAYFLCHVTRDPMSSMCFRETFRSFPV